MKQKDSTYCVHRHFSGFAAAFHVFLDLVSVIEPVDAAQTDALQIGGMFALREVGKRDRGSSIVMAPQTVDVSGRKRVRANLQRQKEKQIMSTPRWSRVQNFE